MLNLLGILVRVISGIIITTPSLWIAGRMLVGEWKAKFGDALWIVALGIIVEVGISSVVRTQFANLIQLVIWLYLVKSYFETDWIRALIISIVAVVVSVVVTLGLTFVLAVLGISLL